MDNAAFHKRQDIQDLLAQHGHQILWLPPYSPDLNPIEKMWAWVKAKMQKSIMKMLLSQSKNCLMLNYHKFVVNTSQS